MKESLPGDSKLEVSTAKMVIKRKLTGVEISFVRKKQVGSVDVASPRTGPTIRELQPSPMFGGVGRVPLVRPTYTHKTRVS